MTAIKPPAKKWRVGSTGESTLGTARPYASQNKAYEAVRGYTVVGVPATVWHYEVARGSWVLYERLDANGDPA